MKKKVMFVIPSLVGGGAEKVLVDITNYLDSNIYDVFLILFEKKGVHLPSIPHYVTVIDLKKTSRYSFIKLILKLVLYLRKIRPDVVMSFMEYSNLITILASKISKIKCSLIITVHNYLTLNLSDERLVYLKKILVKKLYNHSDFMIVPSEGIKDDLVSAFNCEREKIKTINHAVDINKIDTLKSEHFEEKLELKYYILAVGRLTKQKGYLYLINAYKLICDRIKENLVILGIGEDEKDLKEIVMRLGLQKRVHFLGFQENPYKFMENASIFVLSSLWESFAIVIIEAMVCSVPVISTDCPSGPGEIITNGKNGILVPPANEKDLADAMLKLLKDEQLRRNLEKEGRKRSKDFKIDNTLSEYENVFG